MTLARLIKIKRSFPNGCHSFVAHTYTRLEMHVEYNCILKDLNITLHYSMEWKVYSTKIPFLHSPVLKNIYTSDLTKFLYDKPCINCSQKTYMQEQYQYTLYNLFCETI